MKYAKSYVASLRTKKEAKEEEVKEKERAVELMKIKLQRLGRQDEMLAEIQGKLEQTERLATSMLERQEQRIRDNKIEADFSQRILITVKYLDTVWSDLQGLLKAIKAEHEKDEEDKVAFFVDGIDLGRFCEGLLDKEQCGLKGMEAE